jgi:ABC-type sulfate/molybdate transport systems ATPase subunit
MTPLIEIRDLTVQRGGRTTLFIDALQIQPGEVLALVGPNGAGKSTLLLALAHLIPVEHGQILFRGRPLSEWDVLEYRRKIAFVFQEPLLLDLAVAQNVALGLRFRGLGRQDVEVRAGQWLRALGIAPLAKRRASQLSGGEAQRVSLARALALDPELLLLDEPFGSLDPPAREKLIDDLSALLAQDHRATVLVTHDLKEAARLGDRIGVIVGGRLRQVGTARQIKARPADQEVAEFLRTL